eukprot:4133651-Amphidinium_carterae.2
MRAKQAAREALAQSNRDSLKAATNDILYPAGALKILKIPCSNEQHLTVETTSRVTFSALGTCRTFIWQVTFTRIQKHRRYIGAACRRTSSMSRCTVVMVCDLMATAEAELQTFCP